MYMDRDIRNLLSRKRLPDQFNLAYCGNGNLATCRTAVWSAIADAGAQLTTDQGTPTPSAWRADATAERIDFGPLALIHDALHEPPERDPAGHLVQAVGGPVGGRPRYQSISKRRGCSGSTMTSNVSPLITAGTARRGTSIRRPKRSVGRPGTSSSRSSRR